jgi:hypothetical protein
MIVGKVGMAVLESAVCRVKRCRRRSGVFFGLDAELDKDTVPLLGVRFVSKEAVGMALTQHSELFHELGLIGNVLRVVVGGVSGGLAPLTLCLLAFLAGAFAGALGHAFTSALCHVTRL